jgi:outer membrane protein OmpA-like peptidoglycan-associated protein
MIIRSTFIAVSMLLTPFVATAQEEDPDPNNMVPNGSFEDVNGKLKRLGSIEMATGWKSSTGESADLFSEEVPGTPISAPRNQYGDQSALTGVNYAGVRWWSFAGKEPRTYLQAKFKKPLKKGQKYCVKYYVSLADLSKYATNELGAYMAKLMVPKKEAVNLTYTPQVPNLRTKIHDDMYTWQGVCGVYDAAGEEQFLLIGNFAANEKTDNVKIKRPKGESRPQMMEAYYFIDDVSVTPIKSNSECTCEQLDKAESEHIFSRRGVINPDLKPAEKADQMIFYFKRFQRSIDRSMEPWLDELVGFMKADETIRIQLTGYVDATEKDRMRMRPDLEQLAKERADTVKDALVEAGIDAARISTLAGSMEAAPDADVSEVGMSKSRRVEVGLTK